MSKENGGKGRSHRILHARFSSLERKMETAAAFIVLRGSIFDRQTPLLLAPTSPAPATRDKLFPRARSRRRHELFQLEPANSQGRSRCLAMEEEGRGKRGRRVDKRRKKEWKIVIHGRYRLCPPLPPLPRFPDNLLIVLLIQEQEISSFDASNLF